ncbi:NUDIX hydrolase [Streptomyces sp. NPDC057697]|uniref:NUDIX hydrolase n=1 Tax=Streptomyces sp. NPDC057697 TaxID=3346219 RepID=UPI00369CE0BE
MPRDPERFPETRCSVAVFRGDEVLLVRSTEDGHPVWKLPGGHVRADEGLIACARRELREETGLRVTALHCAVVLDIRDPRTGRCLVEIVLVPDEEIADRPRTCEPGREPYFVPMDDLPERDLRPSLENLLHDLRALHRNRTGEDAPAPARPHGAGTVLLPVDAAAPPAAGRRR